MNRSVLIIFILILLVALFALVSRSNTNSTISVKTEKKDNAEEQLIRIDSPEQQSLNEQAKELVKEVSSKRPLKEKSALVKRSKSVETKSVQTSVDNLVKEDPSEAEIHKEKERLFVKDFIASRKAVREYKSHKEQKEDLSTISGKGTGGMMAKWKKQQKEKKRQEESAGY